MERFSFDVKGKVALVTGGAQGLGRALAEALAGHGARTVAADLKPDPSLPPPSAGENGLLAGLPVDVTDPESVEQCFRKIEESWGPLDILVNNAGVIYKSPIEDLDIDAWRGVIEVNLTGVTICSRFAAKTMKALGRGRIINISSMQAFMATPTYSAYTASKAGVSALTKVWAAELAPFGVTVNAICPSFVETPMIRASIDRLSRERNISREKAMDHFRDQTPQRRILDPAEIAFAVLYLASSLARGVTGHDLVVAAGCLLR